ncbi:MAG: 50S ribosomal protein L11 methyltransferase [Alphaproteobacteria bacterium]|nr:50S ribosomal protein L11 methyltransferase [Alphaproteobacteria bacterium]
MNLYQIEGSLEPQFAEELSSLLEEDVVAFSWYEKEPENWFFQLIFKAQQEKTLKEKVAIYYKEKNLFLPEIHPQSLQDEDWVSAVYRDFPPLHLGQFYIYGSHIEEAPPKGLIPLCINAATAFGSGQHESTEGCLKALTFLAQKESFSHPLDMGCGSGILALAMASLWKAPTIACDNDPEAIKVTLKNTHINHLELYIEAFVSEGFSELKMKTFDIITANILAGPLCQMAGDAISTLSPGGFIILSGLLNRQAEDVIDSYRSHGAKLVDQLFLGDWSTLILRKESNG